MEKNKRIISLFIIFFLLISSFSWIGNDKAEAANIYLKYQLPDSVGESIRINSKDQYDIVANWIKYQPSDHTGWSAVLFRYNAEATTIYDGKETHWWPVLVDGKYSTQDGFEGVTYPVSMFKDKIIAEHGQALYDRLLAGGYKFDVKSGQSVDDYQDYNYDSRKEFSNPRTGDLGFLYYENNVTVYLDYYDDGETGPTEPTDPTEPEPEPEEPPKFNNPPTAIIDGPTEVELGESFCLRSASYDTDGTIEIYDWGYSGEYSKNDDEGFTETTSSKCGLYFEDVGEQDVWLQVTDDGGKSDDTTHRINVVYPIPDAGFEVEGHLIENRAVKVIPDRPYGRNDEAEKQFPIVENVWTIEALDNSNQSSIIDIEDDLKNSAFNEIIEVLFRKKGEYKVTHYIKNNRGQSDSEEQTITIKEDLLPIAKVETSSSYYLGNDGKEEITIRSESTSNDDIIDTYRYEIVYDDNNDGVFDETPTVINTFTPEIKYNATKLGDYSVKLTVIETFDEATYESHVNLTDNLSTTHRKYSQATTTFKVDNMAPVVSLEAIEPQEVEIVFNVGDVADTGAYTTSKLQSAINSNLVPSLAANNISADIQMQEPVYYKDIPGGYYLLDIGKNNNYRYLDETRIPSSVQYLDYASGIMHEVSIPTSVANKLRTTNILGGGLGAGIDYDGNLYYTNPPQTWDPYQETTQDAYCWHFEQGNADCSNIELYKYDVETNSSSLFVDKQVFINKAKQFFETRPSYEVVRNVYLDTLAVGENENVYALVTVGTRRIGKTSAYWDSDRMLFEFSPDGILKNAVVVPFDDDESLKILSITKDNIYWNQDGDNIIMSPISTFWTTQTRYSLEDVGINSRMFSTNNHEYYYGVEWGNSDRKLWRSTYNKTTKAITQRQLLEADFLEYSFQSYGTDMQVFDYEFGGATRSGSVFLPDLEWYYDCSSCNYPRGDQYASVIVDDSNFAMDISPYKDKAMSSTLRGAVYGNAKSIFFGQDGTYQILDDYYSKQILYKFNENTNAHISTTEAQTDKSYGPYCRWDDDDDECRSSTKTFTPVEAAAATTRLALNSETLPVRAYKKSLKDTLADTKWKSKTSKKFYVTLSNQDINDLPTENAEVASLLNEKDIHYISLDTTSTKSLAQQLMTAIEQQSLQITTTYTDTNVNNSMKQISDFVKGIVFPVKDTMIDIHLGVDDSQYPLAAVQTEIVNTLQKRLTDSGITASVTSAALTDKTVNGMSVRKFNSTKKQDYYVLFKDSALTSTNLNHMVGDLLLEDAYFIGVGKSLAKSQFDTAINKNMYRGTTIVDPTSVTNAMEQVATYLVDKIRQRKDEVNIYGTTEENRVLYKTSYWDFENNPKFAERYKTLHEPTVFENGQGKMTFSTTNAPEIFTKVGKYQPTYQAQDDPLVGYTVEKANQFSEYRKWSNLAGNINIYVHRLPVPDFRVTLDINSNWYSITNQAYDLDKQSIDIGLGGGISSQNFQWRLKGELIWKDGLPPNPLQETVYELKNEVIDFQNQKNFMIKEMDPRDLPSPPVAEFEPQPAQIEVGDTVKLINTSYDPKGKNMGGYWYYKKSTESTYTHFATGWFTNGVPDPGWSPTTNIFNSEGTYDVKLHVWNEYGLTDEVVKQVIVTKKSNQKPVACMNIPNPNFIGDTIFITSCASDPDGNPLTYSYEVTKPDGTKVTYASGQPSVDGNGNLTLLANIHPSDLGTWSVVQTISDGMETASVSGQFEVLDQIIQGDVAHTDQWLKNLQKFNAQYPSKAFNLDPTADLLEFTPGERFVLNSSENTSNRLVSVESYIKESSRGIDYKSIYGTVLLNRMDSQNFTNSLWHENMLEKFRDQEVLTFEFVGTFANGWVDTKTVQVRIKDDSYWKQHTSY